MVQITFIPFTDGKRILFRSNSITSTSSSTLSLSSGNYYTTSLSIPGTSDHSSLKANDANQLINFYLNGDFSPGNNPAINATGNNGNYDATLLASKFLFFINGDLNTGGGGTTFNATMYVEGTSTFGSPTYLQGALSSGGNIDIGNASQFIYNQNIGSDGCSEANT